MWLVWMIYLADIAPSLVFLFVGLALILLVPSGALFVMSFLVESQAIEKKEEVPADVLPWRRRSKWGIIAGLFLLFLGALIPGQKSIYLMAAAYAGVQIVESEQVQNISKDVLDILENKLAQYKKEAHKDETTKP